jgi:nucleotide-binding universal stress UspA family protein
MREEVDRRNRGARIIPQINKILFATNLTKNSSHAFYFATDMARKHNAKIRILHCIATLHAHVYSEGLTPRSTKLLQEEKEQEKAKDAVKIKKLL